MYKFRRKHGEKFDICLGNDFLNITIKSQATKEKWDYI